jgi:hypothetical protein
VRLESGLIQQELPHCHYKVARQTCQQHGEISVMANLGYIKECKVLKVPPLLIQIISKFGVFVGLNKPGVLH